MNIQVNRLPKSEIEILIELPWPEVQAKREELIKSKSRQVSVKGFRKGKAPSKLAQEKLDPDQITQDLIQAFIPQAYTEAVQKHDLKPVVSPKVSPLALEENQAWKFKIRTAEAPPIPIDNYPQIAREAKKSPPEIWTPDQKQKKDASKQEEDPSVKLNRVLEALLTKVQVELSELVIEDETNRLLAQSLNEIKSLGMSLDSYLAATGKTVEQFRAESAKRAKNTLKLELIIQAIAEKEHIQVSQEEITKFIDAQKDEKVKSQLQANTYPIAGLIRRQKTLDHLLQVN